MSTVVNLFMTYQFLKRLVTPFNQWDAYHEGVIDEDGNIILPPDKRPKISQRESLGKFDVLVLKLKKLMEKVPGGKSRIASYAAALYLIKEDQNIDDDAYIEKRFNELLEEVSNGVGGGAIAGGGYNGPDDIKVSKRAANKYKKKNKQQAPRVPTIVGD